MTVELLRSILGWGAICNIAFLSVIFCIFLAGRELIYSLHGRWFGITKETINAILYGAMAFYKLAIFAFFVMPYIALRFFV
ncbi:MAG: hypothetical protein FWG59_02145 [Betaproteobacteria bacterium]|nr:hypothetical protein [Betaproteobacteria bacterium]